jgi:hypothetical protein
MPVAPTLGASATVIGTPTTLTGASATVPGTLAPTTPASSAIPKHAGSRVAWIIGGAVAVGLAVFGAFQLRSDQSVTPDAPGLSAAVAAPGVGTLEPEHETAVPAQASAANARTAASTAASVAQLPGVSMASKATTSARVAPSASPGAAPSAVTSVAPAGESPPTGPRDYGLD